MDRKGLFARAPRGAILGALSFSLVAGVLALAGCGSVAQPARNEDVSRQNAPVPACIMPMPVRPTSKGTLKRLRDLQYWELVFPTYDATNQKLPQDALACTGQNVFKEPLFEGGDSDRGWPRKIEESDVLLGSGGDRLKVAWFRTHTFKDGATAGAIALVRSQEEYAEAYAIGALRSVSPKPYLMMERMGPEVAVTAQDDVCLEEKKGPCETRMTVYLPRNGVLKPVASFATKKRDFVMASEPGSTGRIEYRLTAAPKFTEEGIRLYEQVLAVDEGSRELRRAEVERVYKLENRVLTESEGSLWPRVFPRKEGKDGKGGGAAAPKITWMPDKETARTAKALLADNPRD
ncbi:MAG: hypothetical protein U0235_21895 [Polyangiaceae bacterium]